MPSRTLSDNLRTATSSLHAEVERAGIMPSLLQGKLNRPTYCRLLRNLHEIYSALEGAMLQHATHPCIAPIYFPSLERKQALESDLRELHGKTWQVKIDCVPACTQYADRLREIRTSDPVLLIAHSYVRYLGDLSGGQILKAIVAKSQKLEEPRGTRFYQFPPPGAPALAGMYRNGLNLIELSAETIDRIVFEAKQAFSRHGLIFNELALSPQRQDPCSP
jgi:heme oxygenase